MDKLIILIISFTLLLSCLPTDSNLVVVPPSSQVLYATNILIDRVVEEVEETVSPLISDDTVLNLKFRGNFFNTLIRVPHDSIAFSGTILALHGWNLPHTDWCEKTSLCEKALEQGYIVVLPDMGKSTYSNELYPQTRKDWMKYPTRKWLLDTLLVHLQEKLQLFLPEHSNYVLGLSTGARGATLIALDRPEIFKAAASLSGDFDQALLPNDNIYKGFYGSHTQFKERWQKVDNVVYSIKDFKVPIYLGHGFYDKVSPSAQTIMFYDTLQKYHPELHSTLHIDTLAKHDYQYWNSEVDAVLDFFNN
jgi:S-formylglutathione hydrolase FrmB